MPFVYELALSGAATEAASATAWFEAGPAQAWARIAGLSALDVYRPVEGTEDPYNKDDGPPLLIAVAEFASAGALEAAAPQLELSLAGLPLATRATFTPMERKSYPVAGETTPGPLRAPFSYVVRYRRPAEDEAAFVAHYVADHPRLEGQFPRIRSVMCYFPLPTPKSELLRARRLHAGQRGCFRQRDGLQRGDAIAGAARDARALSHLSQVQRRSDALPDDARAIGGVRAPGACQDHCTGGREILSFK